MALAAVAPAPAVLSGPAVTPVCELAAFAPDFARDRAGFCLRGSPDPALFRTLDAGRTWQEFPLPGFAAVGAPFQLMVSPLFGTDRTVFLHASKGLFAWSDPATGFTVADPLANAGRAHPVMAPFVEPAVAGALPGPVGPRVDFAYAHQTSPTLLSPPLRRPVAGATPSYTERFLVPAARAARPLALATVASRAANAGRIEVRECDWTLACATVLTLLPPGDVYGAWLSPRYAQDRTAYVAMQTNGAIALLRSTDAGRTFRPLAGAVRALAATNKAVVAAKSRAMYPVTFAADTANPRRLVLRIPLGPSLPGAPGDQVFTSADGGATWHRSGYAFSDGRRGTLPWYSPAQSREGGAVWYAGARLFALASGGSDRGGGAIYCSLDHGKRWRRGACR